MLHAPRQLIAWVSLARNQVVTISHNIQQIYRMRMELKHEFSVIARSLALPQVYVQREYVKAWKIVSQQKKERDGAWQADSGAHLRTEYKPVTFRIA